MAKQLFTIGYEQATPKAFMGELKRAKVKLVVDTRAVAASRRPGFSKRQLAAALDEEGIAYIHLQKLGTPTEGAKHLKTPEAKDAMEELVALVRSQGPICLLCYERDPAHCHRSRIAEIIHGRTKVRVTDLIPPSF